VYRSVSIVYFDVVPDSADSFTLRSGRTGRMGRAGTVVTLVSPREEYAWNKLVAMLGRPITVVPFARRHDAVAELVPVPDAPPGPVRHRALEGHAVRALIRHGHGATAPVPASAEQRARHQPAAPASGQARVPGSSEVASPAVPPAGLVPRPGRLVRW
jgi:superfamily II DNA/RNA helicase